MTIPEALIHQLVLGRVVPFVGSGVSLAVQPALFPTWSGLLGALAERLQKEANEDAAEIVRRYLKKGQLNKAADEAFDELAPAHFLEVMQATFGVVPPDDVHLDLPAAMWALRPKLVVTTNYDRVLQWSNSAARIATNSQPAHLADLFAGSGAERPIVWHLHGHIDDPDSLIVAPRQYERLYRAATDDKHPYAAARLQLRTLIGNHPLLFVGFGLQDEYVMDALATALEIFGGYLRPSYALLKTGDDRARTLWDKHKIQVIEYADYGPPLVELMAELARQVSARPEHSDDLGAGPAVIPPAYIQWLTEQCADITPFGMAPTQGQSVSLQQVYVPSLTRGRFAADAPGEVKQGGRGTGKAECGQAKKSAPREDVAEEDKPQLLLDLLGERSLYVSGDPGTGKSTFCRWVAWLAATCEMPAFEVAAEADFQEKLPESLRGRLPVLVRLREFREYLPAQPGRRSLTLAEFQTVLQSWLDRTRPGGLCWSDVAPHLAGGSLLLILDGVDELPLAEGGEAAAWSPRESLLAGLTAAAAEWLPSGNRLLVTSRPYGLTPHQVRQLERAGLAEARLEPLPESLQSLLAARWFVSLPKTSADGRKIAASMLQQVRELAGDVALLAANPLLLTAICIIYGEGKQLPQDKHNLYDRIVNTALHSRYAPDPKVIAPVRGRLAAVALGMHTGQPHQPSRQSPAAEVTCEELDQILGAYMGAAPETESGFRGPVDAREDLLSHSDLLTQGEAQRAGFYHLSFQEFLAAERLVLLNPSEDKLLDVFCQRSMQPDWRPTLSFLFGSRVAQPGWRAGVALLNRILAAIDVTNLEGSLGLALSAVDALEILLGRDLKLQEPLLARFREICLAAIEQNVDSKARGELTQMLSRVGDPRMVDDLRDPSAWVEATSLEMQLTFLRVLSGSPDQYRVQLLNATNSRYPEVRHRAIEIVSPCLSDDELFEMSHFLGDEAEGPTRAYTQSVLDRNSDRTLPLFLANASLVNPTFRHSIVSLMAEQVRSESSLHDLESRTREEEDDAIRAAAGEVLACAAWEDTTTRQRIRERLRNDESAVVRARLSACVISLQPRLAGVWESRLSGSTLRAGGPQFAPGYPAIRISRFRLQNIGIFEDTGELLLNRNMNLLLGENSSGKSTVLKCLGLAAIGTDAANEVEDRAATYLRKGAERGTIEVEFQLVPDSDALDEESGYFFVGLEIRANWDRFRPLSDSDLTLKSRRGLSLPPRNAVEHLADLRSQNDLNFGFVCGYGPNRTFSDSRFAMPPEHSKAENEWVLSLFRPDAWLINPEMLTEFLHGETPGISAAPEDGVATVLNTFRQKLKDLLPQMERVYGDGAHDVSLFQTDLKFNELSDGYRSVLAFVGHLLRCSLRLQGWQSDPTNLHGIALIDEVDLHLHPKWQKHVVEDLHNAFPNMQLVVASHSPLVAGAFPTNSISFLQRISNKASVEPIPVTFKGWRADQILTSDIFGLESSRDSETTRLLNQYRELVTKIELDSEQEVTLLRIGDLLGQRVPSPEERAEAREAMRILDQVLGQVIESRLSQQEKRLRLEVLMKVQQAIAGLETE